MDIIKNFDCEDVNKDGDLNPDDIMLIVETFKNLSDDEQKEVLSASKQIEETLRKKWEKNEKTQRISFVLELTAMTIALLSLKGTFNAYYILNREHFCSILLRMGRDNAGITGVVL